MKDDERYTSSAVFLSKNPFSFRFYYVLVSFRFLAFSVFTNAFLTNAFFSQTRFPLQSVFQFDQSYMTSNKRCTVSNGIDLLKR